MLFENWFYHLPRAIPEAIALVALGTALVKEKYTFKQIALTGSILGMVGYLLQQAPFKYGVHIPLGIIAAMFAMSLVLKLKILKSATAALLSFIVLVFIEWATVIVQTRVIGYSEEQIIGGSDLSRFLFSLPPLIIFIAIAILMQFRLNNAVGRAENKERELV